MPQIISRHFQFQVQRYLLNKTLLGFTPGFTLKENFFFPV